MHAFVAGISQESGRWCCSSWRTPQTMRVFDRLIDRPCPPRCLRCSENRCCKHQRAIDKHLYRERFLVESFFQKIKRFRRVAMRFEKLAAHYLAMVTLASVLVWLT